MRAQCIARIPASTHGRRIWPRRSTRTRLSRAGTTSQARRLESMARTWAWPLSRKSLSHKGCTWSHEKSSQNRPHMGHKRFDPFQVLRFPEHSWSNCSPRHLREDSGKCPSGMALSRTRPLGTNGRPDKGRTRSCRRVPETCLRHRRSNCAVATRLSGCEKCRGGTGSLSYVGSNSTIQLSNFEGLVLGCVEAKFCK